jgi:hypothetical protein
MKSDRRLKGNANATPRSNSRSSHLSSQLPHVYLFFLNNSRQNIKILNQEEKF